MIRSLVRRTLTNLWMARLFTPRSAARVALYALRRLILRQRIPGTGIVALTFDCQCRCACCSSDLFRKGYEGKPGMPLDELLAVVERIADAGSPRIHFSGGESLLNRHLTAAVSAASRRGLLCFVETNGLAMTEDRLRALKDAGVACVNVSLDSADPAVHDALRGVPGCHAKAVAALRLCAEHGVACMVSTYATHGNIRDGGLAAVVALARELRCTGVRVLAAQPSGAWIKRPDVILDEEDITRVEAMLPLTFPVLNRTALIECPLKTGYKIYVLPDGSLAPCEHLPFVWSDSKGMDWQQLRDRTDSCSMFDKPYRCMPRDPEFRRDYLDPLADDSTIDL
ncbi:MAG: hypothetical protein A2506_10430 [Elusimicrobia bacterium RIFOXYD12_FULL_66_9]|nr:MAG: hypothetical protein A2506_10430 [Elusimicrobia bacterium RIFOXYD12_FULL_66_9]